MSNKRKTRAMCPCLDCGWPTIWRNQPGEWYMVRDHVWTEAGAPDRPVMIEDQLGYYLCIGCLEQRLGRELTAADFTDAEVNEPRDGMTDRLLSRILGAA